MITHVWETDYNFYLDQYKGTRQQVMGGVDNKLSNAVLTLEQYIVSNILPSAQQYIAGSVSAVDNILPTSRKQMFYIPRQCFSTYFK